MLKTGNYKSPVNLAKIAKLDHLWLAYRNTGHGLAAGQWQLFFTKGKFDKNAKLHISSRLSGRYIQTCQYQVVGTLTGYLGNCANYFARIVQEIPDKLISSLTRIQLLYLNKYRAWYSKSVSMQGNAIPAETLRLTRNIMRGVFKRMRKPRFNNMNLALDEKVAVVEDAKKPGHFKRWVKLSTLDKYKPIYLPVAENPWFDKLPGEMKAFVQINKNDKHGYMVGLVKDVVENHYLSNTKVLGLDVGLRTLLATSDGDLHGTNVFSKLLKWDSAISTLARNRQKAGLRVRSKRYDKLVNRVRAFLKNEVYRTLNRVLMLHKPAEVCVEVLDFRSPDMSRRMNRLVQNFGRRVFNDALAGYAKQFGFTISNSQAAYSSKECNRCHYVDDRNRKGDLFSCLHCGHRSHADVNASRNHKDRVCCSRRSRSKKVLYVKRMDVLQRLLDDFATPSRLATLRRKVLADPHLLSLKRRHSSPGLFCMLTNPYFQKKLAPWRALLAKQGFC